jgi:ElaB/YqjD/DUF883 family membrane-anchored ribosome-binding protein
MSSSNIPQAQDNLEAIFTGITDKLENVLTEYRALTLDNETAELRLNINSSCDELEELKDLISDSNQGLTVRTQAVDNICDNIDDIILDIRDFINGVKAPTHSEKALTALKNLGILFGMRDPAIPVPGVATPHQYGEANENYFLAKKAEIDAILAANPELNAD